jgi:hypothetical protein
VHGTKRKGKQGANTFLLFAELHEALLAPMLQFQEPLCLQLLRQQLLRFLLTLSLLAAIYG